MEISQIIAQELSVGPKQVAAAMALLAEGATVPFIARYRKEATGGLDDTQLRQLEQRLIYLTELNERREAILKSIDEQQKLTPELKNQILAVDNKATLEDLYLPYKPKRRTKAQIAREAGLQPLADELLADQSLDPKTQAEQYLNKEHSIESADDALSGAQQILMEQFSEHAALLATLRNYLWNHSVLVSKVMDGKQEEGDKFADYFDFSEALNKVPSHRALAIFRGRRLDILRVQIQLPEQEEYFPDTEICKVFNIFSGKNASKWLQETANKSWRLKLFPKLELEVMTTLRQSAEESAIDIFGKNLKDLLMAAPAGAKVVMGLDPGFRTGVKVAIVDSTGKLLAHDTLFPHPPHNKTTESAAKFYQLCKQYHVELISIGNGTASKETDKFVSDVMHQVKDLKLTKIMVSEAGASVYSASEFAAKEFPSLDVSFRGAVSIARRLQDPLAELVKITPKSIGVGQYQHDVNQVKLAKNLDDTVEDCVNAVGVDVNTASVPLLTKVSGLNQTLAENLVQYRDEHGAFAQRSDLLKVQRFGAKTFEQAAGFLRIIHGKNPLDCSAVHPEAYPVVEKIVAYTNKSINELMGNHTVLHQLNASKFTDENFGLPTVTDILQELEKPGRDPRPEFKTANFKEGIDTIKDLSAGMTLEGVITNITDFGAFVDIGVHRDGLVHKSAMAKRYVEDPRSVVSVGDIVKVKITEVDVARNRINLTMVLDDKAANEPIQPTERKQAPQPKAKLTTAFAAAFQKANDKS